MHTALARNKVAPRNAVLTNHVAHDMPFGAVAWHLAVHGPWRGVVCHLSPLQHMCGQRAALHADRNKHGVAAKETGWQPSCMIICAQYTLAAREE